MVQYVVAWMVCPVSRGCEGGGWRRVGGGAREALVDTVAAEMWTVCGD